MKELIKLCAASLRFFLKKDYHIELKSSYAHEVVAAYFGYKSKAALLADKAAPFSNLREAEHVILVSSFFLEERLKNLENLPTGLPDLYEIGVLVYSPLIDKKILLKTPWPTYEHLARFLVDTHLYKKPESFRYYNPIKIEKKDSYLKLTVRRFYQIPKMFGVQRPETTYSITLQRVAGHIGYGKPKISLEKPTQGEEP